MNLSLPLFLGRYTSLVLCLAGVGLSQTVNLNLASDGSTAPTSLNLNLSSTVGSEPAGLQFTLAYPATLGNVTIDPGAAATAAGKAITCTGPSGTKTCLLTGQSTTSMANGVVAVVGWGASTSGASVTATSFQANSGAAASSSGTRLPTIVQTSISIPSTPSLTPPTTTPTPAPAALPTLQGLSCASTQLTLGGSVRCLVGLSAAAPASGIIIQLSSNTSAMSVPTTVTLPAGVSIIDFAVGQKALSATPGTLTVTYGTQTLTASLALTAPVAAVQLQQFSCKATQLSLGGTTRCTVTLSGPAPAGGASVQVASNNPAAFVPSGVTIAAGATQADVTVAQKMLSTAAAKITATYSGQSLNAVLALAAR